MRDVGDRFDRWIRMEQERDCCVTTGRKEMEAVGREFELGKTHGPLCNELSPLVVQRVLSNDIQWI